LKEGGTVGGGHVDRVGAICEASEGKAGGPGKRDSEGGDGRFPSIAKTKALFPVEEVFCMWGEWLTEDGLVTDEGVEGGESCIHKRTGPGKGGRWRVWVSSKVNISWEEVCKGLLDVAGEDQPT